MKKIGMLAGMSWESSIEYYRIVNEEVKRGLGGLHSAECVMVSVDFDEYEKYQRNGDWQKATERMIEVSQSIENGGADFLLICTNTMHKMADEVQAAIQIPLLHIVDATAKEIKANDIQKIGLLGTKFTMEQEFYVDRLKAHGHEVLIPEQGERNIVHRIIYEELVLGKILESSISEYKNIIENLLKKGAQGIVLGCTEIGLLVQQKDYSVPIFDTTYVHACAAVDVALGKKDIKDFLPE
jgi:aspartate racemase